MPTPGPIGIAGRLTTVTLAMMAALTAFGSSPPSTAVRGLASSAPADSQGSEPSPAAGSIIFQDDFNGYGTAADILAVYNHMNEDHVGYATGLQNAGPEFTPEMLGDGHWHRITVHARLSSGVGANDGIIEGWIDGVKRWSHPNPVAGKGYDYFQTPTVFNGGSPVSQSEWMDNLVVWKPIRESGRS